MIQSIIVGALLVVSAAYVVRRFMRMNRSGGECGCGCSGGCSSTSRGCSTPACTSQDSSTFSLDQPKDRGRSAP